MAMETLADEQEIDLDAAPEAEANVVENPDGSAVVDLGPDQRGIALKGDRMEGHFENLAETMDIEELMELGEQVAEDTEEDIKSRAEWERTYLDGLKLLGLEMEETNDPFEGACTATHPLLMENAVKFQSKAISETFPPGGPVKAQVLGFDVDGKLEEQAKRIKDYLNYQITEEMVEYFDEHERMLLSLAIVGSAFKKFWYDESLHRPSCEYVPIEQIAVNYYAPDLRRARRITQVLFVSQGKYKKDVESGIYTDADLGDPNEPKVSDVRVEIDRKDGKTQTSIYDEVYTFYEQHLYYDFEDGEGEVPIVAVVDAETHQVLSVRRNWAEEDTTKTRLDWFVHYKFVPGLGFYGYGLIHLLGNLTKTATLAMRALVDAGQFATLPAGFKARGVRINNNDALKPGEWRDVDGTGFDISKAIIPAPYKEPSATLFNLMDYVVNAGQKFADSTDQVVADSTNYGPVGTTLALLDASTKFFSAIHKRIHASMRNEFRILARINKNYMPNTYPYMVPGGNQEVLKADFNDRIDILPISDPNIPSNAHRLALVQFEMQLAQQAPQLFNLPALAKSALEIIGAPNANLILAQQQQPKPQDPISDIHAASKGMPIAAFPGQNHDAHIAVKSSFLLDPNMGGSPVMEMQANVIRANIQEHIALKYAEQVNGMAQQIGQGQVDMETAQGMAAEAVLKYNMSHQDDDNSADIEYAKLEVKKHDIDTKAKLKTGELMLKKEKLDIERRNLGAKVGLDIAKTQADVKFREAELHTKKHDTALNHLGNFASMHNSREQAKQGAMQADHHKRLDLTQQHLHKQQDLQMAQRQMENQHIQQMEQMKDKKATSKKGKSNA